MSTQQQTSSNNQSTLQFNPLAQGDYNQLTGAGTGVLTGYMNNPFGNASYNLGLQNSMKGASQAGQNNMGALASIMKTSGMGGTAGQGFQGAQQAQMGRANQSMMSQANLSNIQAALSRQMAATGMGMSFSPQMTGQSGTSNSTQSTSGLGTWLPQLMGAGLGAMTGGLFGGGGGGGGSVMQPSYMSPGTAPTMPAPFAGYAGMPSGSAAPPPAWMAQGFGG